jgi:hypothetical protein
VPIEEEKLTITEIVEEKAPTPAVVTTTTTEEITRTESVEEKVRL